MRKNKLLLVILLLLAFVATIAYAYTTYTSIVSVPSGTGSDTDSFHTATLPKENNHCWWTVDFEAKGFVYNCYTDVVYSVYPSGQPDNPKVYSEVEEEAPPGNWSAHHDEGETILSANTDYTAKINVNLSYCYYQNSVGVISNVWIEE